MALDPWIYAIDGQFWSGKTLIMTRYIVQLYRDPRNIIITNIKLHFEAPNVMRIDDIIDLWVNEKWQRVTKYTFLDVLQYIWQQDDKIRTLHIKRNDRLRWFIMLDEWWILLNQHNRKQFPFETYDYMLQVRKINVYFFLWVQKFKNLSMQIREHVTSVLYFRPLFWLKFLKNKIWVIRIKSVDVDWVTETRKYLAKDDKGDLVTKEEPIDSMLEYLRKPSRFRFYDDLYLNKKFTDVELMIDYSPIQSHIDDYLWKKKQVEIWFTQRKIRDLKNLEELIEEKNQII